jgi:hypothetical protein
MSSVTLQALTRTVQDFLSQAAGAAVLESGAVAFDLALSKYSKGRLAIVELKADQDIHLPLLGLDDWSRSGMAECPRRAPWLRVFRRHRTHLWKTAAFSRGPGIVRTSGHRYLVAFFRA